MRIYKPSFGNIKAFVLTALLCLLLVQAQEALCQAQQKPEPSRTSESETAQSYRLNIDGEVEKALELSSSDLKKLPRRTVKTKDHDGKESNYIGFDLVEVLKLAGVKFGEGLRGKALALYLVVGAADNYKAVFALPELDPAYTDKIVLLADQMDGKPLSTHNGPLQVIVPDEKKHARWVRKVTTLRVLRAE